MCVEGVAAGCMHRVYAEFVKAKLSFRVFCLPDKVLLATCISCSQAK